MRREIDRSLILAVLFLLGFGVVQIYSSSFIFAVESFDDGLFFVKKQALFVCLAIAVMMVTAYLPWKWIVAIGTFFWAAALIGVCLTLVPGLGVKVGGATRWLNVGGGLRFEPSELLKYTMPFLAATAIQSLQSGGRKWVTGALFALLVLPFALLLKQPDFGTVAILAAVMFMILFSQGLKWKYVALASTIGAVATYLLIVKVEYRLARITAFLDPWSDPAQKGFQIIQSLLGFHSGGFTGVGLGQGQGKLFFLPEAHTDFTMSVLGEELGFVGVFFTLVLFGFIVLRGLQIAAKARDGFAQIVSLGIILTFAITAFVNASVAMGMLPTKGLGMPFLSYGGSALIATAFGIGVILNIGRAARESKRSSFINIKG